MYILDLQTGFFCFFLMASLSEIRAVTSGENSGDGLGGDHTEVFNLTAPRHLRMDPWVNLPQGGLTGHTICLGHICAYYPNST